MHPKMANISKSFSILFCPKKDRNLPSILYIFSVDYNVPGDPEKVAQTFSAYNFCSFFV